MLGLYYDYYNLEKWPAGEHILITLPMMLARRTLWHVSVEPVLQLLERRFTM